MQGTRLKATKTIDIAGYEIAQINPQNTQKWQLDYATEHGHIRTILFTDRKEEIVEAKLDLLQLAYQDGLFSEWLPKTRGEDAIIPKRIAHKYKKLIEKEFKTEFDSPTPFYAFVQCLNNQCTCEVKSNHFLQFEWGQIDNCIEYEIGDNILWDGVTFGYIEVDKVYVRAMAESNCAVCECGLASTFIEIERNRIVGLKPELLDSIKYSSKGPFVTDECISWNDYQKNWIDKAWSNLQETTEISEIKKCKFIKWPKYDSDIVNENIHYLILISKYRNSIPKELFERSLKHFNVNTVAGSAAKISLSSNLKTCALLHGIYEGNPCLIKFYWGSLIDFPEYTQGDQIMWSEYSIGDRSIEGIVYARGYIESKHHVKVIIHIKNNQIVDIQYDFDKPAIDLIEYNELAQAFYSDSWLPWMILPDTGFINSRRPRIWRRATNNSS